jgi:UDP-glucose 4-epimerase
MKILITGGYGLIGGRLANYFYIKGFDVIIGTRNIDNSFLSDNYKTVIINWDNEEKLREICIGVDYIIHAAGMDYIDCKSNPILANQFNGYTTNLFVKAAIKENVKKFIFISTIHVYSSDLNSNYNEFSPINNNSAYAISNSIGEDFVLNASNNKSIDGIVLRLSNSFGFPIFTNRKCWSLIINNFCLQASRDLKIIIDSEINFIRDFIPIRNTCDMIYNIIISENKFNYKNPINICREKTYSLIEIAEKVKRRSLYLFNNNIEIISKINKNNIVKNYSIESLYYKFFIKYEEQDFDSEIDDLLTYCKKNII